jgi:5-methylcytosine-specific restriction endonuclease McrA
MKDETTQNKELTDIICDAIDLLFPLVGTYESAFYMYLLRHSIIERGTPHIRTGVRPLQNGVVQSAYAGSTSGGGEKPISKISYAKVSDTLKNLESVGAIRKENDANRDGTLYRIMLPEEIPACQQRKLELRKTMVSPATESDADYYNVRENRLKVYERDLYKCKYCSKQLTQFTATLDHLTPVARGGDNALENLVTACLDCNSKKNVKPLGDFMADSN